MTQPIREQFALTTQRAFRQFINEQINDRLKSALNTDNPVSAVVAPTVQVVEPSEEISPTHVTTTDELEAFYTIRAIVRSEVETRRVTLRDVQSYCGVLLDDNNRKPICRLYFNRTKKILGLFDNPDRKEVRIAIENVDELHQYADRLCATIRSYGKAPLEPEPASE